MDKNYGNKYRGDKIKDKNNNNNPARSPSEILNKVKGLVAYIESAAIIWIEWKNNNPESIYITYQYPSIVLV